MSRAIGAEEAEHLAALDAYAQVAHGQLTWLGLGLGLGTLTLTLTLRASLPPAPPNCLRRCHSTSAGPPAGGGAGWRAAAAAGSPIS